ncbi:MAG: sugar ABC transporter substrate-binding protein [Dysosmobacter sp.]|uniref:sugar ABC transporter substrate-binding protein n=1 Tax=Dysosmobacter sp. TaxID=2591382 RepID=UPI003D8E5A2D
MKKFFALALSLVMALSLVACGQKEETPAETPEETPAETPAETSDIEVAVVLKTLASEYWGYVKAGCDAAAADLGITVTVVGPGAESDIEGQVAMIEQQIGAGCDAIVCAPNDAGAAAGALQAALDAGIPVLSVDTNVGIEGQTSFVGTSNVDAAYEGAKWAIEQVGSDAKAVIIYGQEGDNTSNMRREGYQKACDEAGVEVLSALSGQNTTDGATKTMEDLLNAYPDQIKMVFCHNDDTAIGAMNACKNAGVTDMTIVGFDGNASAVDLILAGEMVKATVAQQPYEMGYQVVEAAVKAINGETVEEVINAPVEVVTAENGQAYLDNLEAMKG